MSIYGDRQICIRGLKKWLNEFDFEKGYIHSLSAYESKEISKSQFDYFKQLIFELKDQDDWRIYYGVLTNALMKRLFQVSENAIRIANYYECFVIPVDAETKKKLIKGFDYSSIGAVNIYNGAEIVGCIGQKSDLIWSVFYDYFIYEDEYGSVDHVYGRHEELLSLQLINVDGLDLVDIEQRVKEILIKCSLELNLHFRIESVDRKLGEVGVDDIYQLEVLCNEFEPEPAMYFNNAIGSTDPRVRYLSYYQVLEYFFIRSQNVNFLKKLDDRTIRDNGKINHRELRSILKQYNKTLTELESLKLVLTRSVNIEKLKVWIKSSADREALYCTKDGEVPILNLSASDEKIISKLAARIYRYRCAIAHAKGDIDEYIALPYQSDKTINSELPLIRYVASLVLKECSEV